MIELIKSTNNLYFYKKKYNYLTCHHHPYLPKMLNLLLRKQRNLSQGLVQVLNQICFTQTIRFPQANIPGITLFRRIWRYNFQKWQTSTS